MIDWNDGRLITLTAGETAKCESLDKGQIYAVLIYNSTQNDVSASVTVAWSNTVPPSKVVVPGSTGDGRAANYLFLSGDDSNFISISLAAGSQAEVTAFIVSVSMPKNTTGLNSSLIPEDGQFQPFNKYDRYYTESYDGWRSITINSPKAQFISLQIQQKTAKIIVLNQGTGLFDGQVSKFGSVANDTSTIQTQIVTSQTYDCDISANSGIWVWMNGDSQSNSEDVKIALQQLSLTASLILEPSFSNLFRHIRNSFKQ